MPAVIPTPVPEVVDRWTIARLKLERLTSDQADKADLQRQVDYYARGVDMDNPQLMELAERLYEVNGQMWDAEYVIRKGEDDGIGLEEIGRRALITRDLNRRRMAVKNQIVDLVGEGFKDVKMNYAEGNL